MLRQMLLYGIQPTRLVHGLQNHDELMLETTHLSVFGEQIFEWEGNRHQGEDLFTHIHEKVISAITGDRAPYNKGVRNESWQLTALNFGRTRVEQSVSFVGLAGDVKVLWSNLQGVVAEKIALDNDSLTLDLHSFEAKLVVVFGTSAND